MLRLEGLFWIWENTDYTVYITTNYNQGFSYRFMGGSTLPSGKYRLLFDTKNYPYQGIYYGDA